MPPRTQADDITTQMKAVFLKHDVDLNTVRREPPLAYARAGACAQERVPAGQPALSASSGRACTGGQAFNAFDQNGDGKISRTEFQTGLKQLSIGVTMDQMDSMFDLMLRKGSRCPRATRGRCCARRLRLAGCRASAPSTACAPTPKH